MANLVQLVLTGYNREPPGLQRACCALFGGRTAESALIFGHFFDRDLVVPTRHGVSVAGAVVSLGAANGG